jgi:hypothetical protein
MTDKPTRRYKLCADKIESLEDVKKIFALMDLRIQTDDPEYDQVKQYFCLEIVPRGYIKLIEKVGYEGIANMNWNEMESEASKLLNEIEQQDLEFLNEDEKES